jgi:hypothetical protein
VHTPTAQPAPAGQRLPQPPQLLGSRSVSTHAPPQFVEGAVHIVLHTPPEQA